MCTLLCGGGATGAERWVRVFHKALSGLVFAALVCSATAGGLGMRDANVTLRLSQNPATYDYRLDNALPGVDLTDPVTVVTPPG